MTTPAAKPWICPCGCRPADIEVLGIRIGLGEIPLGRRRCACRHCEWTPECGRLAVQGEQLCGYCTGQLRPGSAPTPPRLPAWMACWGSWWSADGIFQVPSRTQRHLRGQTGRRSDGQLPRTDQNDDMAEELANPPEPEQRQKYFEKALLDKCSRAPGCAVDRAQPLGMHSAVCRAGAEVRLAQDAPVPPAAMPAEVLPAPLTAVPTQALVATTAPAASAGEGQPRHEARRSSPAGVLRAGKTSRCMRTSPWSSSRPLCQHL